jgi:DNA-binding MarR family transcriptional regulator
MSTNGSLPYAVADVIEHIGRRLQSLAYSENLNPAQWTLLRFLAKSNPSARTPTGFARFHLTTKSAATQTIEALLRKRLIRTAPHPHDQRAKLLELTARGQQALHRDPMNKLVVALERMSGAELHQLAQLTSRLAHDLYIAADQREETPFPKREDRDGAHSGD